MWWILPGLNVLVLCGTACLLYFSLAAKSYAKEKGKNLATKEDIADITRKVESVRAEFTAMRDAAQHRHELSMAALDQRLEAHQTAYFLWRQMLTKASEDDSFPFFRECEEWWEKHCLYLSEEAENAFLGALRQGHIFKQLQGSGIALTKAQEKILSAGNIIRKAAQLPALARDEEPTVKPGAIGAVQAAVREGKP